MVISILNIHINIKVNLKDITVIIFSVKAKTIYQSIIFRIGLCAGDSWGDWVYYHEGISKTQVCISYLHFN